MVFKWEAPSDSQGWTLPFLSGKAPQASDGKASGVWSPCGGCMFCTCLVHVREEHGHAGVCLGPDAPPRGGLFSHLSPLTCQSWYLFQVIPLAAPGGWPGGLRSVHWEKHLVHLSVCMCFCVLPMSALYHCQSIRQNTNISMENCISSLKFSSLSTQPMWELTNSSHLKFGQCPGVFSLRIPHWKCHY